MDINIDTNIHRYRHIYTQTHRHTDTQTHRQRETETESDREDSRTTADLTSRMPAKYRATGVAHELSLSVFEGL